MNPAPWNLMKVIITPEKEARFYSYEFKRYRHGLITLEPLIGMSIRCRDYDNV